jgi:DNA topoisomerase-1
MQIAQRLYEAGQITYMRTDGVEVAPEAQEAARRHIAATYGGDYIPNQPPVYEAKTKHAQEAHEAIRPPK